MSEYQYYEFQAIDRPLTAKEQAKIRKLSSRVQLTPTQAIFLYDYGDFRGKPEAVLAQYFDVMFYIANWGSWRLIFRFPEALVDPQWFQPYLLPHAIAITQTSKYIVLDIEINDEEGIQDWVEGEGWLPRLLPLRDDLMAGDLRLLYLAWLRAVPNCAGYEMDEDPVEPPIPPNLNLLSPPLKTFIEVVEMDADLVAAAAQDSPRQKTRSKVPLETYLSEISAAEQREFLLKLVRRESHVDLQLIGRLKELAGTIPSVPQATPGHRPLSELEATAGTLKAERKQKEKTAARKKRIRALEALAPKEEQTWQRIVELIALKQSKPYDEATALLKDLRDLAAHQGKLPEFSQRFEKLKSDYSNRPALIRRFGTIKIC